MEPLLLILGLLFVLGLLSATGLFDAGTNPEPRVASRPVAESKEQYSLYMSPSPEPFFSPDRSHIWDPHNRKWIQHHNSNPIAYIILGMFVMAFLLWVFDAF